MRKYLFIFKTELMNNLQYIFNILTGFIGYFIILYILMNLWQYLYSDNSNIINGYTMSQMVWYVIITEILWGSLGGRKLCHQISNDVKSGNITYHLNKPYNYVLYSLSNHLGNVLFKLFIYIILGMLVGFIFLGKFPSLSIISVLLILITSVLSLTISILLMSCIGMFSFFIEDANPFYWIYSKFILILGTIFPIEYFPNVIQGVLEFSPIYVVSYGPAKLFVDFSFDNALSILIAQIIYIIISYLLCLIIYKKGAKRLNVNGG